LKMNLIQKLLKVKRMAILVISVLIFHPDHQLAAIKEVDQANIATLPEPTTESKGLYLYLVTL